jgi:hypothetical protein
MIMKWKNHLGEGFRYKPMVSSLDIFATSAAVAEAQLMPGKSIDGTNLLPFLIDSTAGYPHDYLFWQRGFSKALRSNEWKFILNEESGDTLLFHLIDDPYEENNVSGSKGKVKQRLLGIHNEWSSKNNSPLWPSMIYFYSQKEEKAFYFDQ